MKIFLFDVDGTLTPARKTMDPEHARAFLSWMIAGDRAVYMVSGSDRKKILQQISTSVLSR